MKLTKAQLKEAAATIYNKLSDGLTDKEVIEDMGLAVDEYMVLKEAMLDQKADEVRSRPHEHIYIEYMIAQPGNVRDLTAMIDSLHKKKQYSALVSAVRARSDILDRLVEKGQEFGLIHKTPERKEIVAGVMIAELSNTELKKLILGELGMLNDLRKQFGEKNFAEVKEENDIHYGRALPPKPESEEGAKVLGKNEVPKHNKANASKVRKGRRVLRKPAPINVE